MSLKEHNTETSNDETDSAALLMTKPVRAKIVSDDQYVVDSISAGIYST